MFIANLKVKGSGLIFTESDVCYHILITASKMLCDSQKLKKLKGRKFEGVIATDFKQGICGSIAGTIFDISIESDYGDSSMTFILAQPVTKEKLGDIAFMVFPGNIPDEICQEIIRDAFGNTETTTP